MRRVGIICAAAAVVAGCVTPVVLENPTTRQRVNCTAEAERLAFDAPDPSNGTDVPRRRRAPTVQAFDLERQCTGELLREGYVCVTGCTTPPQ